MDDRQSAVLAKVNKQKEKLYSFSFASAAILGPIPVVVNDNQPTWCTDGVKIFISTEFTERLTDLETRGVLLHEESHVSLLHTMRMAVAPLTKYEHRMINMVADFIINGKIMRMNGYGKDFLLPSDALTHRKYSSDDNWSLEDACADYLKEYEAQKQNQQNQGNGQPTTDGAQGDGSATGEGEQIADGAGCGDIIPHPVFESGSDSDIENAVEAIQERVNTAKMIEKSMGSLTHGGSGTYTNIDASDWGYKKAPAHMIKYFMKKSCRSKLTMDRPNRRFISQGAYLPSRLRDKSELVCCIDSSGSVGMDELQAFRTNIVQWARQLNITKIRVAYVDGEINNNPDTGTPWFDIDVTRCGADNISLGVYGGGGTSFDPIFNYIEENREDVAGLIYMTDGYGSVFHKKPKFPVMWVTTRVPPTFHNQSPWGEIVYI